MEKDLLIHLNYCLTPHNRINNAAIVISNGKIHAVGGFSAFKRTENYHVIDLPEFYATPHWCLKQLGIVTPKQEQGSRYQTFRDAIRRLSGVVYDCDRFYDPVRGEHRDVTFGFLKYSLPLPVESTHRILAG